MLIDRFFLFRINIKYLNKDLPLENLLIHSVLFPISIRSSRIYSSVNDERMERKKNNFNFKSTLIYSSLLWREFKKNSWSRVCFSQVRRCRKKKKRKEKKRKEKKKKERKEKNVPPNEFVPVMIMRFLPGRANNFWSLSWHVPRLRDS